MSKGPWKKETLARQREAIARLREVAARERQETNDRVMAMLEEKGPLSVNQIVSESNIARSTVKLAVERLRNDGLVRRLPEKKRVGKSGVSASLYELGCEDDEPINRAPVEVIVHRHPMDVAFFGDYRRAA